MADQPRAAQERIIQELVEASSLGTDEVKAIRAMTPPEVVERIMQKAEQRAEERAEKVKRMRHE